MTVSSSPLYVAPWRSKAEARRQPRPDQLQLGCVCEINLGIDTVQESVYFARRKQFDELWVQREEDAKPWCAVRRGIQDDAAGSCRALFEILTRARGLFSGTSVMLRAGLVRAGDLESLQHRITAEFEKSQRRANLWRNAEIIRVAAELDLSPEPSGSAPKFWQACCPGKSHPLYINAEVGEWGCGWCRRKGGPDDLRVFVAERRERAKSARAP